MDYQKIHAGDIISVTITGIQPYGAFALLNDHSSGLIHISEISDRFVADVNNFVTVGETVHVKVLDIDKDTGQAKLSLKALNRYNKRRFKRHISFKRAPIKETPKGFQSLETILPQWIERGINKEEDI